MRFNKLFYFLFFIFICCAIVSCSSDSYLDDMNKIEQFDEKLNSPSTEVLIQGQKLNFDDYSLKGVKFSQSRVNVPEETQTYNKWPYANETEGWEVARFSIRADGVIPGYIDQSSTLYYGRSAGKQGKNRGRVSSGYPYGNYNDRDFDYTKVNQKTGNNIGLFRYVLDTNGMKTQLAILEQPSVIDILDDERIDLENAIAKNQNVTKNQKTLDDVNALIALGEDYLNKHVLWYVVKEVGGKRYWHVNGVIVDYEVADAKSGIGTLPDEVEIDIHQQIHKDWNEIKTSVHVRSACESIKINIPLEYEDIVEQDDFAIRIYDFYYKEYEVTPTITHNTQGITIEINNIPSTLINELWSNYGDGLTIEIHSYCTKEDIWEKLSQSKLTKLGKQCTVKGQITTAYDPEKKQLIYAPKN